MTTIPEAAVDAAATAMLTRQMRGTLARAGLEWEPGQDAFIEKYARLAVEAAAPLIAPPHRAEPAVGGDAPRRPVGFRVRKNRTSVAFDLTEHEAIAQSWAESRGVDYEGLYRVGDRRAAMTAIDDRVSRAAAPLIAPPDGAVEAAVLAEREACAALAERTKTVWHQEAPSMYDGASGPTRWSEDVPAWEDGKYIANRIRARSASPKPGSGE